MPPAAAVPGMLMDVELLAAAEREPEPDGPAACEPEPDAAAEEDMVCGLYASGSVERAC